MPIDKQKILKVLEPFAEQAKFALSEGPGYLRKKDWVALKDMYEGGLIPKHENNYPIRLHDGIDVTDFGKIYRGYVIREKNSNYFIGPTSEMYRVILRQQAARFTKQGAIEYIRNGFLCKDGGFEIEDAR